MTRETYKNEVYEEMDGEDEIDESTASRSPSPEKKKSKLSKFFDKIASESGQRKQTSLRLSTRLTIDEELELYIDKPSLG